MSDTESSSLLNPQTLCQLALTIAKYESSLLNKNPRIPSQTGDAYLKEVLACGNHNRIQHVLRMPLSTFEHLSKWMHERKILISGKRVSVEEQLAIFLSIVGKNWSNREAQERFQHSGDTISRYRCRW